jgi:hypothetical protein
MKLAGEQKPAARKKATRTSPVTDVDLFTYTPNARDAMSSNFLENSGRLAKYALANYGELGKIIKMKAYPEIE